MPCAAVKTHWFAMSVPVKKFRSMTLPDTFIEQDSPKNMYEFAGLNASQISKKILDVLFTKDSIKVVKN